MNKLLEDDNNTEMSDEMPLRTESTQFHVAEYTSLHGEIRELIHEARTLERQVVFATGAVWAWLAIYGSSVPSPAWYIPVLFSIGGAIRTLSLKKAVDNIAAYIQELEAVLAAVPDITGWESYRMQHNITAGVMRSAMIFWILLCAISILVPTVVLLF